MTRATNGLPRTGRDIFRLPLGQRVLFTGVEALARLSGAWRYPMRAYSDLERMRFIDKVYWLYKTTRPVRRAMRGSGLEEYFAAADRRACALPEGFRAETEIELAAVGDLMSHAYLARSDGRLYEHVHDLVLGADISMANLECPIVPHLEKELVGSFETPPPLVFSREDAAAVTGHGDRRFSFVSTACNHSLDHGEAGVESTLRQLADLGVAQNGLNATESDAERATIVERNGIRVGIVAFTFGLNAYEPPAERPRLVNVMQLNDGVAANDFGQLERQLEHCRSERADFVIAHLHWGFEHELYPTPLQVELAHHLADIGVDLVIGHHPHVVQPFEVYETRRDEGRLVPIYYSLGNLVNPFSALYLCSSGVARVTIARGTLPSGERRTYVARAVCIEAVQEADEATRTLRLRAASPA